MELQTGNIEQIDASARKVLISFNPKSGASNRQELIDALALKLTEHGFEPHVFHEVEALCQAAVEALGQGQLRTVVSAGGDGTASMLVNRLPAEVAFTIFPLGTANLLARFLETSRHIQHTVEAIAGGRTVRLDAGKANERLFLVVASCGFDADVVDRIHRQRTGHISYWSYGLPIIDSIRRYRFPAMRLIADGQPLEAARWAFAFNIPQYAMDLRFVENADAGDGQLDLCTFRDGGFFQGIVYFFAVLLRRHRLLSSSRFTRFQRLSVESHARVPFELDGDPGGYLPVEISVVPKRLRVVVSEAWIEANSR